MYKCKQCGETDKDKMMSKGGGRKAKTICKKCHNYNTQQRGLIQKQKAVEYKGGKCQICGYSKCVEALEFHHINPLVKDPAWKSWRYWAFDRVKKELDQCMLLCANCHREIHSNELGL